MKPRPFLSGTGSVLFYFSGGKPMKKRTIITALTAAVTGLSAAAVPLAAELPTAIVAEAASNGTFQYSVSGGEVTIEKYLGSSPTVTIPSKIANKPVVKIADNAFTIGGFTNNPDPMNITSVTFQSPSYVTTIGNYAFYGAPLQKVVLPNTINTIGTSAFEECKQLKSLEIKGACQIMESAFQYCSALKSVKINSNSVAEAEAFTGCTALAWVNYATGNDTSAFIYTTDANGHQMPILTTKASARKVIDNCFRRSKNVKFVDNYVTALCEYIVKNETCSWNRTSWMPDAVKARVLYDWLILHCDYEDTETDIGDRNNHIYSSVFLSYALNERGAGVGEAVCEGFSKAYNMLLTAAGIESYLVEATPVKENTTNKGSHVWNLVKINGKYYQCDATADNDETHNNPGIHYLNGLGTNYRFFLLSDTQMKTAHNGNSAGDVFRSPHVLHKPEHPLLCQYSSTTGERMLKNYCVYDFNDVNEDGILDNDYDLNGVYSAAADGNMRDRIVQGFGLTYNDINNGYLPIWLKHMCNTGLTPEEFVNYLFSLH